MGFARTAVALLTKNCYHNNGTRDAFILRHSSK